MRLRTNYSLIILTVVLLIVSGFNVAGNSNENELNSANNSSRTELFIIDRIEPEKNLLQSNSNFRDDTDPFLHASGPLNQKPSVVTFDSLGLYNGLINYSDVLLIVNDNSAISKDIGSYFAQQRGLPPVNICNVTTPTTETISRTDFNSLRTQIENYITSNGLKTKINFIVTTKGVPLRVSNSGSGNQAAVDSELVLILGQYSSNIGAPWYFNNPYYSKNDRFSKSKYDLYLVTRLTGYTADEAKGLVDKATASYGKRGMFMLDVAPGRDAGGYKVGNDWMRNANTILKAKGFNVTLDETTTFITDKKDLSGYASWGSNDGAYSTNHALNVNLESDNNANGVPDNWFIRRDNGDFWSRNNSESQSGTWSMKVDRPSVNGNVSALSQNITVQQGVRFYMTGYVNLTNMSSAGKGVYLQIAAVDGSGNIVKYYNGSARKSNSNDFVTLSQIPYEPVSGITKIMISVVVEGCSGTVHIDTIRLMEIKPHNTYIPGSIAETIVSTGGRTFNYPPSYGQSLVSDLIREGVTGVKGYVYEPYLDAIAHPDILFDRYTDGYNLAESYYMASVKLSWMDTVIGDPKLAPYIDELPELAAVSGDINFSIPEPTNGDKVTITGTVHNSGKRSADDIKIQFYIGDPGKGGYELGAPQTVSIPGNDEASIQYLWDTANYKGMFNIYMAFDIDDTVMEQDDSNNKINRSVYVNNKPEVLNLRLSKTLLFRTELLAININGSDIETAEGLLECQGEYRFKDGSFEGPWMSFSSAEYNGRYWIINHTIDINTTLGTYDIRVRFTDNEPKSNPGRSDWFTSYDAYEVINNNPSVIEMIIAGSEVFRTQEVRLKVKANDIETSVENLSCNIEYKEPSTSIWKQSGISDLSDGYWITDFKPDKTAPLGLYSFRAVVFDEDSSSVQGISYYLTDALEVKNNPAEVLNISFETDSVLRLNELDVIVTASDIEDPDEYLVGDIESRHNTTGSPEWKAMSKFSYREVDGVGQWTTTFKPRKTAGLGLYDFRAKFTDRDGGDHGWLVVNEAVLVTNNIPVIESLEISADKIIRGANLVITLTGYDIESSRSDLKLEMEYVHAAGAEPYSWTSLEFEYIVNRWEADFTASDQLPLGFYHLRTRLLDKDITESFLNSENNSLWQVSYNYFRIIKGFPGLKDFSIETVNMEIGGVTEITITTDGNRSENDEITCRLQFKTPSGEWNEMIVEYDSPTGSWNSEFTSESASEIGIYEFRIQFISPDLGFSEWIYPDEKLNVQESKQHKEKEPSSLLSENLTSILLILLIVVIISVLLMYVIISKRKKSKKTHPRFSRPDIQGEWLQPGRTSIEPVFTPNALQEQNVYTAEIVNLPDQQAVAPVTGLPALPESTRDRSETDQTPSEQSPDHTHIEGAEPLQTIDTTHRTDISADTDQNSQQNVDSISVTTGITLPGDSENELQEPPEYSQNLEEKIRADLDPEIVDAEVASIFDSVETLERGSKETQYDREKKTKNNSNLNDDNKK